MKFNKGFGIKDLIIVISILGLVCIIYVFVSNEISSQEYSRRRIIFQIYNTITDYNSHASGTNNEPGIAANTWLGFISKNYNVTDYNQKEVAFEHEKEILIIESLERILGTASNATLIASKYNDEYSIIVLHSNPRYFLCYYSEFPGSIFYYNGKCNLLDTISESSHKDAFSIIYDFIENSDCCACFDEKGIILTGDNL